MVQPPLQLQLSLVNSCITKMLQPLRSLVITAGIVQLQLIWVNSESSTVQMAQLQFFLAHFCTTGMVQSQFESLLSTTKLAQLQLNSYTTPVAHSQLTSFMSQLWEFPLNCCATQMLQQQLLSITTGTEMTELQLSSLYSYATQMPQLQVSCIDFGITEIVHLQFSRFSPCATRTAQLLFSLISLGTNWMVQLGYCTNIHLNKNFIPSSLSLNAHNFTPQLLPDNSHIEQLSHIQLHTTTLKQCLIMKMRIHCQHNLLRFAPSKYVRWSKLNQLHKKSTQKPIKFNHHAQLKSSPRRISPASSKLEYPPNACSRLSSSINATLSSQVKKKLLKRACYTLVAFIRRRRAIQPNLNQVHEKSDHWVQPLRGMKISTLPASNSESEYLPNACSWLLFPSNVPLSSQVKNRLLKTGQYKHNFYPLTAFIPQGCASQPKLNQVHKKSAQKPLNLKNCVQLKLPSRRIFSKLPDISSPPNICLKLSSLASVPLFSEVPMISHPTGKNSTNSKKQSPANKQKQQHNPPHSTPPLSHQSSTCSNSGSGGSDDEDNDQHRKRLKSQCEADRSTGDLPQVKDDEIGEFNENFEEEISRSLEVSDQSNPSLVSGTIPAAPEDSSSKDDTRIVTDKTRTPHLNGRPPGNTALTLQSQGRSKLGETPIRESLLPGFEVPLKGPSAQEHSPPHSKLSQESSIPPSTVITDLKPSDSVEESLYLPQCRKQVANQTEAAESHPQPPTDSPTHPPSATHSEFGKAACETNQATHTTELALPSHKTIKFTCSVSAEEEAEEQSTLTPPIKSFHSVAEESSEYEYDEQEVNEEVEEEENNFNSDQATFFCDVGSNKLSPLKSRSSSEALQPTSGIHQVNESAQAFISTSSSQQMATGNVSQQSLLLPGTFPLLTKIHPHGSFSNLSCLLMTTSSSLNPPTHPVDGWSDDSVAQLRAELHGCRWTVEISQDPPHNGCRLPIFVAICARRGHALKLLELMTTLVQSRMIFAKHGTSFTADCSSLWIDSENHAVIVDESSCCNLHQSGSESFVLALVEPVAQYQRVWRLFYPGHREDCGNIQVINSLAAALNKYNSTGEVVDELFLLRLLQKMLQMLTPPYPIQCTRIP